MSIPTFCRFFKRNIKKSYFNFLKELRIGHVNDPRKVIANGRPEYFGGEVSLTALVPTGQAELGTINFEKWCSDQLQVQ